MFEPCLVQGGVCDAVPPQLQEDVHGEVRAGVQEEVPRVPRRAVPRLRLPQEVPRGAQGGVP